MRQHRGVQSLKTGAIAQLIPVVAGYGTVLVVTPYIVTELGLHDFGIWSMTGAIAQYAALFDLGVSRAANRHVALFHAKGDPKGEGAVLTICVSVLLALGTILCALALLTSHFVEQVLSTGSIAEARLLMLCALLIMLVGLLARVLAAASIGRGRQVPANVGLTLLTALQALGGVVALAIWQSLPAFAIGTAVGTTTGFVIVVVVIMLDEHHINFSPPSWQLFKTVLRYGVNSQIASAGSILLLQSGKLIAGLMLGPAAAGVYELASRLAMGAQVLGAAIPGALMPHLTRSLVTGGLSSVKEQYEHLTQRNAAVAVFIPFAMAATIYSAIPLWLDSRNGEVIVVLFALLPGIATNVSTGVCSSLVSAIGRPGILAQVAILGGMLQVIFAVVFGDRYGFLGLALSFGIGIPLINLTSMLYMHARLDLPIAMYTRGIRGPFTVGLAAMLSSMPISLLFWPDDRESAILPFALSIVVFTAVYSALGYRRDYLPQLPKFRRT